MLVEEWRGNHLLYFLDGQKIPFAFGHLDFFGHLQFVPRVRFNQFLTYSLVQCGTQGGIIGMSRLGRNRLAPCGLAGRTKPVDIIKVELFVQITEPGIRTELQQVLAGVVYTVQVTRSPVLVVFADNGQPV